MSIVFITSEWYEGKHTSFLMAIIGTRTPPTSVFCFTWTIAPLLGDSGATVTYPIACNRRLSIRPLLVPDNNKQRQSSLSGRHVRRGEYRGAKCPRVKAHRPVVGQSKTFTILWLLPLFLHNSFCRWCNSLKRFILQPIHIRGNKNYRQIKALTKLKK